MRFEASGTADSTRAAMRTGDLCTRAEARSSGYRSNRGMQHKSEVRLN